MIDKCAAVRYNNTVHFMTQFNTSQQLSWIEVTLLREPKSVPRWMGNCLINYMRQ